MKDEEILIILIEKFLSNEIDDRQMAILSKTGYLGALQMLKKKYEIIGSKISIDSQKAMEILQNIKKISEEEAKKPKNFLKTIFSKDFFKKYASAIGIFFLSFGIIYLNFFWRDEKDLPKISANAEIFVEPTKISDSLVNVKSEFLIKSKNKISLTKNSISLNGEDNFELTKISEKEYKISPIDLLSANKKISISIKDSEKSFDYVFASVPKFQVLATTPTDSATVQINSGIEVEFNFQNFDFEEAKNNFSIEPKVDGKFEKKDNKLIFIPSENLISGFKYQVLIKKGISEKDGQILDKDFSFSFFATHQTDSDNSTIYFPNGFSENLSKKYSQEIDFWGIKNPESIEVEVFKIKNDFDVINLFSQNEENFLHTKVPNFKNFEFIEKISLEPFIDSSYEEGKSGKYKIDYEFSEFGIFGFKVFSKITNQEGFWFVNFTNFRSAVVSGKNKTIVWGLDENGKIISKPEISFFSLTEKNKTIIKSIAENDIFEVSKEISEKSGIVSLSHFGAKSFSIINREDFSIYSKSLDYNFIPFPFYYSKENYKIFVEKEKPLYKPSEVVDMKIFGYEKDDFEYTPISKEKKIKAIFFASSQNFSRQKILEQEIVFDEYGIATLKFKIPDSISTGIGFIEFFSDSEWIATENLQIEEYSLPEGEIEISSNSEYFFDGDEAKFEISAKYFFGEAISNQKINYNIFFGEDWYFRDSADYLISSGEARTNQNGKFEISQKLKYRQESRYSVFEEYDLVRSYPQNVFVEVSADLESGQKIVGRKIFILHPSLVKLNIDSKNLNYIQKNSEILFDINSTNVKNENLPKIPVKVEIEKEVWECQNEKFFYNEKTKLKERFCDWKSFSEKISIERFSTDLNGKYIFKFIPKNSGNYKFKFSATDSISREWSSYKYIWVSENNEFLYNGNSNFSILSNKEVYNEDDEVELTINYSPKNENFVDAVVVFHQSDILEYKKITLSKTQKFVKRDIKSLAPGFAVSVYYFDSENFRDFSHQIKIFPNSRKLNLEISGSEKVEPGKRGNFEIKLKDFKGNPVQGKVAIKVVDRSLIAISNEKDKDIVNFFYPEENYFYLIFSSSQNGLWFSGDYFLEKEGGLLGAFSDRTMADFVISESLYEKSPKPKSSLEARKNFSDSAGIYLVETDEKGEGKIEIFMPDSISSWSVKGYAVDKNQNFGESKNFDFISIKEIFSKISLPKFLSRGDEIKIPITIFNYSNENFDGNVTISVSNSVQINGNGNQDLFVQSGAYQTFFISVFAKETGTASFGVKLSRKNSSDVLDELVQKISVFPVGREITETAFQKISENDPLVYKFGYEFNEDPNATNLDVQISSSFAPEFVDGLNYLSGFPYGCNEQTTSKTLLNLEIYKNFESLKSKNLITTEKDELENFINSGISKIQSGVREDGKIGWFDYDAEDYFLTIYTLQAVSEAKYLGFSVDENILQKQISAVSEIVSSDKFDNDIKIFALYSLSLSGVDPIFELHKFYENQNSLSPKSLGFLAISLNLVGDKTFAKEVAKNLVSKVSMDEVSFAYFKFSESKYLKFGASNEFETAVSYFAISTILPEEKINQKLLNWLSREKNGGGFWVSTLETSFITRSLIKESIKNFDSSVSFEVFLNGEMVSKEKFIDGKVRGEVYSKLGFGGGNLTKGENILEIKSDGNLVVHIAYKSIQTSFTDDISKITIERKFFDKNGSELNLEEIKKGDLITIKISAKPSADITNFLFEDFVPSGFEIVNPNLEKIWTKDELKRSFGDFYYFPYWYQNYQVYKNKIAFFLSSWAKSETLNFEYKARAIFEGFFNSNGTYGQSFYFPDFQGWSKNEKVKIKS